MTQTETQTEARKAPPGPVTEPPPDNGEPLGAISYGHGNQELRFRWVTDGGGDPYLSIWLWFRGRCDGRWRPDPKRGLRIFPREVPFFQVALSRAGRRARRWLARAAGPEDGQHEPPSAASA